MGEDQLSFFASLFQVAENPKLGMWLLYFTILALSVLVYKLGFAKKLPPLKAGIVYLFLALGCTVLTLLGAFLPIAEGLVVAALVLILYKVRLYKTKQEEQRIS